MKNYRLKGIDIECYKVKGKLIFQDSEGVIAIFPFSGEKTKDDLGYAINEIEKKTNGVFEFEHLEDGKCVIADPMDSYLIPQSYQCGLFNSFEEWMYQLLSLQGRLGNALELWFIIKGQGKDPYGRVRHDFVVEDVMTEKE